MYNVGEIVVIASSIKLLGVSDVWSYKLTPVKSETVEIQVAGLARSHIKYNVEDKVDHLVVKFDIGGK